MKESSPMYAVWIRLKAEHNVQYLHFWYLYSWWKQAMSELTVWLSFNGVQVLFRLHIPSACWIFKHVKKRMLILIKTHNIPPDPQLPKQTSVSTRVPTKNPYNMFFQTVLLDLPLFNTKKRPNGPNPTSSPHVFVAALVAVLQCFQRPRP